MYSNFPLQAGLNQPCLYIDYLYFVRRRLEDGAFLWGNLGVSYDNSSNRAGVSFWSNVYCLGTECLCREFQSCVKGTLLLTNKTKSFDFGSLEHLKTKTLYFVSRSWDIVETMQ